jgi:hypothetical protein
MSSIHQAGPDPADKQTPDYPALLEALRGLLDVPSPASPASPQEWAECKDVTRFRAIVAVFTLEQALAEPAWIARMPESLRRAAERHPVTYRTAVDVPAGGES